MSVSRSSRLCWYPAAGQVVVDISAEAVAHVSQVHRCGSAWSCPVCAPVVRAARALEVEAGLAAHMDGGGGAEFVTVTVPHYAQNALAPRLRAIRRALGLILSGAPWKRRKGRLGYVGCIRAVEITYGQNGWHPHLHAVLLFERPLTDTERADLREWMVSRWGGVVAAERFGKLHGRHGLDVRPVTRDGLGDYMTKVDGGWASAGMELARGDLKSSRGLTPFEVLYRMAATGEARWERLWVEYESATFGAHSLEWSPGLRARLIAEPEKDDVELAAAEGAGLTIVRALIEAGRWRTEIDAGTVGLLLDDLEDRGALSMALVLLAGHVLRPIDGGGG